MKYNPRTKHADFKRQKSISARIPEKQYALVVDKMTKDHHHGIGGPSISTLIVFLLDKYLEEPDNSA